MRILTISSLWPPSVLGGAETYAARLAGELRARGHEVGVVTSGVDGEDVVASVPAWPYRLDEYVDQPAWKRAVFHGRDLYDPLSAVVVRRAITRFRPDVVHSHSIAGLSTAALSAPGAAGVAHVHHLHDYWLLCQRTSFTTRDGAPCDRQCVPCVAAARARGVILRRHGPDLFVAPSSFVAQAHAHLDWARGRLHVLRLPLDIAARPARPWAPGSPVTFGYLGQLSVVKGVRTLLDAFSRIDAPGTRLLVAGRGALAAEVEAAGPGVTALGWVDGASREGFWESIDCLVVPSQWSEPGGTVAVEARARGLPVVAGETGGLVEHVERASRPLLFPPGDPVALTESLRRVAADPRPFRPSLDSWPDWNDHVAGIEQVYELALGR